MNLENVTAELRPRSPWEAADFGVRLIRRDAATIYRIWFAITLPLILLALVATVYGYGTLAFLVYWWLEPVADGPILHVISRRLFGEQVDVRAALRATPALAWRNRLFLFSPYRFHFARSIAMPLTQLEGAKGKARRSRASVLNARIFNYGAGLTAVYEHLVLALYLGVILIVFALLPTEYQGTIGADWMEQFWLNDSRVASALGLMVGYLAQTALEPWFVGAGFGLYINCRTRLEAWDLEVAFRRMVQRRAGRLAATACIAALLTPAIMLSDPALAQEPDPGAEEALVDPGISGFWHDDELRPALDDVMAGDALKVTRELEVWRRINPQEPARSDSRTLGILAGLLRAVARIGALIAEFGLWILLGILLLIVLRTAKDWWPYLRPGPRAARKPQRVVLAGGEITAETLPDDIPGEALKLWRDGRARAALGLLYRGSVFAAVRRHGVRLPPSATEGMCVAAVDEQADSAHAAFFRKLVAAWSWCAYGSRDPTDDLVASLCSEWPQYYEANA